MSLRWLSPALCAIATLVTSGQALAADTQAKAAGGYHSVERWKLGGAGGWDYLAVDVEARRLYISRSDRVVVVDADSGKPVGEIANTKGVHGIAIARELNAGYTSNGRANTVTVFDLKTLQTTAEIAVSGQNPDAILYDPASRRVFTFNGRSANATVIDAANNKVIGTIALSGKPEFAVTDAHGRVFVNIEDKGELAAIDAKSLKVVATWPLKPCEEPTGLAFDAAHQRLFSVCGNKQMVITDSSNGKQIANLAIGEGADAAVFDAARGLVFSSNGDGTLTVVHEDGADKFRVVENVPTQKSARTLALDAQTHRLFLAAAEFGPPPVATQEQPRPRPSMVANSFAILVVAAQP
jgi:YVTN family beta-propeller protein